MAKEILKLLKTREVKSPLRGYPTDAGIDFFVPKFTPIFLKDLKEKNQHLFTNTNESYYNGSMYITTGTSLSITNNEKSGSVKYDLDDENDSKIKFDDEKGMPYFLLAPHDRVLIPSGIHSYMKEPGRALIAANKSGIASKQGLVFGAQVIDYSYQGEIHINIINTSTKIVRIYEDMKIIQFVETPIFTSELDIYEKNSEKDIESFYEGMKKDRKDGGFGSTDKK